MNLKRVKFGVSIKRSYELWSKMEEEMDVMLLTWCCGWDDWPSICRGTLSWSPNLSKVLRCAENFAFSSVHIIFTTCHHKYRLFPSNWCLDIGVCFCSQCFNLASYKRNKTIFILNAESLACDYMIVHRAHACTSLHPFTLDVLHIPPPHHAIAINMPL